MSTAGSEVDILDMLTVGAAIKKGGGTEREIDLFLNLVFGETNNKPQRRRKNSPREYLVRFIENAYNLRSGFMVRKY